MLSSAPAYDLFYHGDFRPAKLPPLPRGHRRLERPRYMHCWSFHYSNPQSQNALICQTPDFPDSYDPTTHSVSEAYSDRMQGWDYKHFRAICEMAGTGDQGWSRTLPRKSPEELRAFAQFALKLPVLPDHVRVVHWFNVGNGYSCPTVCAVYRKPAVKEEAPKQAEDKR